MKTVRQDPVRTSSISAAEHRLPPFSAAVVSVLIAVPVLAGCQSPPPERDVPAVTQPPSGIAESFKKYSPVSAAIRNALEEKIPEVNWSAADGTSINRQPDGRCILFLPTFRSDGNLVKASDGFKKVMDAVNPALQHHEFSTVTGLDEGAKGYWSVTSSNSQGARLNVAGRTDVELRLTVPVESASCSSGDLAGLS